MLPFGAFRYNWEVIFLEVPAGYVSRKHSCCYHVFTLALANNANNSCDVRLAAYRILRNPSHILHPVSEWLPQRRRATFVPTAVRLLNADPSLLQQRSEAQSLTGL